MTSWQPYALACLGAVGFLVAKSAYQSGPLAISLPIIDSLAPTVAVVLASIVFGQGLSLSVGSLSLESLGALSGTIGIVRPGRSPLVLGIDEQGTGSQEPQCPHLWADSDPQHLSGARTLNHRLDSPVTSTTLRPDSWQVITVIANHLRRGTGLTKMLMGS